MMRSPAMLIAGLLCMQGLGGSSLPQLGPTVYDENVHVLDWEELRYPRLARAQQVEGVVVIAVTLDDGGKVASTAPISGSRVLIPEAEANAARWRFTPNNQKRAIIVYDFYIDQGVCKGWAENSFFVIRRNLVSIRGCSKAVPQ